MIWRAKIKKIKIINSSLKVWLDVIHWLRPSLSKIGVEINLLLMWINQKKMGMIVILQTIKVNQGRIIKFNKRLQLIQVKKYFIYQIMPVLKDIRKNQVRRLLSVLGEGMARRVKSILKQIFIDLISIHKTSYLLLDEMRERYRSDVSSSYKSLLIDYQFGDFACF